MRAPPPGQLQPIAEQYSLRLIVLFGSQARGGTHAGSDADVAVWMERSLSAEERLDLWGALTRLFEAEVDLTTLNRAEPLLLYQVASTGQLLYESEEWAWENLSPMAIGVTGIPPDFSQIWPATSRGEHRRCVVLDERFVSHEIVYRSLKPLLRYYRQYVGWLDAYLSQPSPP